MRAGVPDSQVKIMYHQREGENGRGHYFKCASLKSILQRHYRDIGPRGERMLLSHNSLKEGRTFPGKNWYGQRT